MPASFDVAVVGGGPGGYVAAIRAAQLGARVALVEKGRLGGTCTIVGCIPTKALLQSSELYHQVQHGEVFGVITRDLAFDMEKAQARRIKIVDQLSNGIGTLLKSNGVTHLSGLGTLQGKGRLKAGDEELQVKDIVIATGSAASRIPIKGVELTINSDQILELKAVPKRLAVIGGGVVGMEWGALFATLGSEVTVLEALPQILPMVEADLVGLYRKHFEGLGGRIHTEARVSEVARAKKGLAVRFEAEGSTQSVDADVVLLATGRVPYTEGLGLEAASVEAERGRIKVDASMRTSADGVWAIGDVIGGIMLAHVASYEGVVAVENIAGHKREADYHAVPNCIYTDPEIANVGLSEREAREDGLEVNVGRYPLAASGRALTLGQTEGAVKVVSDAKAGTILGVQIVGPRASDVIAEATLAVQQRLTVDQLDLTIHAHPTMAESFLQAALASQGRAIEIPNRRRAGATAVAAAGADGPEPKASATVEAPKEETVARTAAKRSSNGSAPTSPADLPKPAEPALRVDAGKIELKPRFKDELLGLYRLMFLIRRFEERAQVEYTRAKIGGYCHLNLGEEATVVGGVVPLEAGDYIYTSYREHGHAIARGVDPKAVMAELFGREGGTSHGRGGSMHIFDLKHRFMGGYGIVGGHLPLATGAGFSLKYQKQNNIVFCMFGDGATNIGAFHESLNFAKVQRLPVIWFFINNQYGMGTSVEAASAVSEIYKRACAYDMESIRVDGMDVLEVLKKTNEMIEKTRRDSEPRFIEAVNYRFKGHSVVDPDKYRDEKEKEKWRQSDPLLLFEHRLEQAKIAEPAELRAIQDEVEQEVEEIVKFADESPNPPEDELYRVLYAQDTMEAFRG